MVSAGCVPSGGWSGVGNLFSLFSAAVGTLIPWLLALSSIFNASSVWLSPTLSPFC